MSMKRNILVTGASGFVGLHLLRKLKETGFTVIAMDRNPGALLPSGIQSFQGDLCDPATFVHLPKTFWGVVHLAAISVPGQFSTPEPVVQNLQMTMNLLDHLESARVLLVSSCHVYAPATQPQAEDAPLLPQGGYGMSKFLCEQLLPYYGTKLDIRIARPFNHVGPGMRPELMVPSMMRRILDQGNQDHNPVIMRGNDSIRDFIDVRDVASAYLKILKLSEPKGRIYNVCSGRAVPIRDVVHEGLRLIGSSRGVEFQSAPSSQDDIPFLVGNPERLHRETGWTAAFSLQESLRALLPNH